MTINKEQIIEAIKDRFIGHSVKQREDGRVVTYFTPDSATDFTNDLAEYITENYQPKTTSTDIEELRKKFKLLFGVVHQNDKVDPWFNGKELTTDRVFDFFLPHLSNKSELREKDDIDIIEDYIDEANREFDKSELKKEAVEDYRCKVTQGILSQVQDNAELTKFINDLDQKYLSSNEKEVSQLNKEIE